MDGAGAKIWEKGRAGAEKNNFTGLLSSVSAAEPAPFFLPARAPAPAPIKSRLSSILTTPQLPY